MRSDADVLAVVVTYRPPGELLKHLRALRSQIAQVLVVDNGSPDVAAVRAATVAAGCEFIANESNLGIATALNQGVQAARARGVTWLATYDQDSLLPEGAVATLLSAYDAHPQRDRIGIIAPAHLDRGTGADYHHRIDILAEDARYRVLRSAITSGSLIRRDLLARLGGFDDRLFIDAVDHDFCLRIRSEGWLVVEARDVVMLHSIGTATKHRLFGVCLRATHHSPLRRYYMTRNTLEVSARYAFSDPVWSGKILFQLLSGTMTVLLYEQKKAAKLLAVFRGTADFLLRRFGPRS